MLPWLKFGPKEKKLVRSGCQVAKNDKQKAIRKQKVNKIAKLNTFL